jgi:DNA-binding IclR family transcriptional regulator
LWYPFFAFQAAERGNSRAAAPSVHGGAHGSSSIADHTLRIGADIMMPGQGTTPPVRARDGDRSTGRHAGIQVIARAAEVLRRLARARAGLGISELARALGLPRSTTHRIVRALCDEGLVRATGGGRYNIGSGLVGLAEMGRGDLRAEVAPHLKQLSALLGETVDLAVLSGAEVLFVDQHLSNQSLRVVSEIGARFPAHCTANGKALLAELPATSVQQLLPRALTARTRHTITRRDLLLHELDEVRLRGFAYDLEEHTTGICAVGTTVRTAAGETAAITVVVPAVRFEESESLIAALIDTREQIQVSLGCSLIAQCGDGG